jgi:tetratricopeptide (TPR) repeat protein
VILTAPVIIALYDRFFLARSWSRLVRERWGLYAALAAVCGTYWFMMASAPEEWKESVGLGYGVTPLQYAMAQPGVILHYLRLTFLPEGFCLDYGWPLTASGAEVVLPMLAIVAMIGGTLWAWRRKPGLAFLGCWFFVILAPSSSIIPIADVMVEHRMYLSLAAVVTAAVVGIYYTARNSPAAVRWSAAVAVVVLLVGLTVRRNQDYESKVSIWADAVRKSPGNPRAQYDLASSLEEVQRYPEAIEHYRAAVQLNPKYADALNNLGHVLVVIGKPAEALPYLRRALELKPDLAVAHNSLGVSYAQQGKGGEAIAELQEAVRLKPDYAEAHNNLGIALAQQRRPREAIAEWEGALRIDPNLADAHNNVAYALTELGRNRDAIAHYERALAINPEHFHAALSYAKLLAAADSKDGGDLARAATIGQRACDITSRRDLDCLQTLAGIYAQAHRGPDAVKTAQLALDLAVSAGRQDLAAGLRAQVEQYRNLR